MYVGDYFILRRAAARCEARQRERRAEKLQKTAAIHRELLRKLRMLLVQPPLKRFAVSELFQAAPEFRSARDCRLHVCGDGGESGRRP